MSADWEYQVWIVYPESMSMPARQLNVSGGHGKDVESARAHARFVQTNVSPQGHIQVRAMEREPRVLSVDLDLQGTLIRKPR